MVSDSLPPQFSQRILQRIGDDGRLLLEALDKVRVSGLRANTLKVSPEYLRRILPFSLQPVEWCKEGFYYNNEERPGQHPLYHAGLYYIQEPSAMYTVEALDVQPGHRVLDLCAAPGGKSTQVVARLKGEGLLVSNEIVAARAKILAFNLEKFGAYNFVVTNTSAEKLAQALPGFFDRIIVDAPCSGEGMFRKEPETRQAWQPNHPSGCAARQQEILDHAVAMLRPGGRLVYSTCTFAEEENEWQVEDLLRRHPSLEPVRPPLAKGIEILNNPFVAKLMPHRLSGEGHFCAVLEKNMADSPSEPRPFIPTAPSPDSQRLWREFAGKQSIAGELHAWGDYISIVPMLPVLPGIKIERMGLRLGTITKGRFEPDHALALSLIELPLPIVNLNADGPEIAAYLRGHVLECGLTLKGWVRINCEGHSVGFGKASQGQIKNHFPKGLRVN